MQEKKELPKRVTKNREALEMKLNKKKIIYGIILVLFIGCIWFGIYLKQVFDYKQAVKEISFNKINISALSDGIYIGECDVDFIYVKVKVEVKYGEIINIDIIQHKNEKGKDAEKIVDKIIEEQNIDVDAVSGATNSSKVIKKAIENALSQID